MYMPLLRSSKELLTVQSYKHVIPPGLQTGSGSRWKE